MTLHNPGSQVDIYVACNGCGVVAAPGPVSRGGFTPQWLIDGKPPPGWVLKLSLTAERRDFCTHCRTKDRT